MHYVIPQHYHLSSGCRYQQRWQVVEYMIQCPSCCVLQIVDWGSGRTEVLDGGRRWTWLVNARRDVNALGPWVMFDSCSSTNGNFKALRTCFRELNVYMRGVVHMKSTAIPGDAPNRRGRAKSAVRVPRCLGGVGVAPLVRPLLIEYRRQKQEGGEMMGELSWSWFPSRSRPSRASVPSVPAAPESAFSSCTFSSRFTQLCSQQLGSVVAAFRALHDRWYGDIYVINLRVCFALRLIYLLVLTCAAAASESIPPALLSRARNIAVEHKTLTDKLADGFDTKSAKKLGEYGPIVGALQKWDKANEVCEISDKCGLRLLIWAKVCHRTHCDDTRLEDGPRTT
jgi:hypothetical protein